jgi:hypothetical protein
MEFSHELILGPADIDRLSIKCQSCSAELVLSLSALSLGEVSGAASSGKRVDVPTKCPACSDDWSKVHSAVRDFRAHLEELKRYGVSFRVPAPAEAKKVWA